MITFLITILLQWILAGVMIFWMYISHKKYKSCKHDGERMEVFFEYVTALLVCIYVLILFSS